MKIENKQNYLEFMFEDGDRIIDYECEMILNNEINGLLSTTRKSYNGKVCFMYNTREKISLRRMEDMGKVSVQDFVSICSSLLEALSSLKEYSLYSAGIVLDKEYIFIDPRKMQCSVVYLPNAAEDKPLAEIQQFFRELLFSGAVKIEDGSIVNRVVEILNKQVSDAASLKKEFDTLLKEQGEQQQGRQKSAKVQPQRIQAERMEAPRTIAPVQMEKPEEKPYEISEDIISENRRDRPQSPFATGKKKNAEKEGKQSKSKDKEKPKQEGKDRSGTVMLLITGVLVVGIAMLFNNGFFVNDLGQLDTSMLAGIAVAALGVEFMAYKKLKGTKDDTAEKPKKKNKKEKKQKPKKAEGKKEKPIKAKSPFRAKETEKQLYKAAEAEEKQAAEERERQAYYQPVVQSVPPVQRETKTMPVPDNSMTEYMDDSDAGNWGRVYLENAMGERFYLTLEHTRIGKQEDRAEIVLKNAKISRLHAEIYQKDGRFFLMDMNSSNGTYLNHSPERLAACADYELSSGDVIRFANEEYVFRMER